MSRVFTGFHVWFQGITFFTWSCARSYFVRSLKLKLIEGFKSWKWISFLFESESLRAGYHVRRRGRRDECNNTAMLRATCVLMWSSQREWNCLSWFWPGQWHWFEWKPQYIFFPPRSHWLATNAHYIWLCITSDWGGGIKCKYSIN